MTEHRFAARRTRSGRVVAVGHPEALEAALGELVELVAPDGQQSACARLVGIGRTWTDDATGDLRAYGYIDAASITPQTSAGAA